MSTTQAPPASTTAAASTTESTGRDVGPEPKVVSLIEPCGRPTITCLQRVNLLRDFASRGCRILLVVGDYHAFLHNSFSGNKDNIQAAGAYFSFFVQTALRVAGVPADAVRVVSTSDTSKSDPMGFWLRVMDIARKTSIERSLSCEEAFHPAPAAPPPAAATAAATTTTTTHTPATSTTATPHTTSTPTAASATSTATSHSEGSHQQTMCSTHVLVPCLRAAELLFLGSSAGDVVLADRDWLPSIELAQRYAHETGATVPTHSLFDLLPDLRGNGEAMSHRNPATSILMDDLEADVNSKVKRAFCAPGSTHNPVFALLKLVFETMPRDWHFVVPRKPKDGGDVTFASVAETEAAYLAETLHPADLKAAVSAALNNILQPFRDEIKANKDLVKLAAVVKKLKI